MSRDPQSDTADVHLMAQLAEGSSAAFGQLYLRYTRSVQTALALFARDIARADIEDLTHDVFLVIEKTAPRFRGQTSVHAWIYGIAVKTAQNWRRKTWLRRRLRQARRQSNPGMALMSETSPERRTQLRQSVEQALERLPRGQRDVLLLHAFEGFGSQEIAEILRIGPQAVRTRLHRARRALLRSARETGAEPLPGQELDR